MLALITQMKILKESYTYAARNPRITARSFVGRLTERDNEKFREWMRGIAKKYKVSYSDVRSFFDKV